MGGRRSTAYRAGHHVLRRWGCLPQTRACHEPLDMLGCSLDQVGRSGAGSLHRRTPDSPLTYPCHRTSLPRACVRVRPLFSGVPPFWHVDIIGVQYYLDVTRVGSELPLDLHIIGPEYAWTGQGKCVCALCVCPYPCLCVLCACVCLLEGRVGAYVPCGSICSVHVSAGVNVCTMYVCVSLGMRDVYAFILWGEG